MAPGDAQQEQNLKPDPAEKAARMSMLLDIYGPLLTDRQREFMQLHYGEDLSFGEIARDAGVSRQAIHDAVKHAEQALESYDTRLGFSPDMLEKRIAKTGDQPATTQQAPAAMEAVTVEGLDPVIEKLTEIVDRMKRSGGILYNADGIARELDELNGKLRQLKS